MADSRDDDKDSELALNQLSRTFFEQAPDAIFLADRQGHLLAINSRGCDLSGYAPKEILPLSIGELFSIVEPMQQSLRLEDLRVGEAVIHNALLRCKEGVQLPVEVGICRMENGNLLAIVRDISQRRAWEQALQESEARYWATLMGIGDGVIATDANGRVDLMNPVAEMLTGWTQAEALGRPIEEVFHIVNEHTRAEVENPVQRVLREGIVVELAKNTLLIARDGREIPIADCGAPIRAADNSLRGVVLVFRDQSEARRAQRGIEAARAFAESIVATVRQPLLVLDRDLRVVSANCYFYNTFQVSPQETVGRLIYELGNRQWDIPELRHLLETILPQNTSFDEFEVEHEFEHLGKRFMLLNARRLYTEDDQTQLILLAIEDITERKRAEQAVERQLHRLTILHQASQQIALAGNDPQQVYVAIHQAVAQLMPAEAFVITLCEDIEKEAQAVYLIDKGGRYPAQSFSPERSLTGWVISSGKSVLLEDYPPEGDLFGRHFGSPEPVRSILAVPLRMGEKLLGMVSTQSYRPYAYTSEDQVLLEMLAAHAAAAIQNARLVERLSQSEGRFRRLAENAPDLIYRYEFTPQRGFTYVSPAVTTITGYTPEEHYADPDLGLKIVHPEDRPLLEAYFRGEGKFHEPITLRWIKKDGMIIWTEQRNVPIYDEAGHLVALEGIARDITERKQAEQALRERTEELEALFSLSAALRTAQSVEEMLSVVLREMRRLLPADAGAVILLDPEGAYATIALADGLPVSHQGLRFPLEESISGQVLRSLQPYVTENYAADPHRIGAMDETGLIGPAVFVPLLSEDRVMGTLMAARLHHSQGQARPFSEAEVRLLTAIGDMVGNALQRAYLHDQALTRLRRLQSLRAIDRAISASLDPRLTLEVLVKEAVAQLEVDAAAVLLLNPYHLTLEYAAGHGFHTPAIEGTRLRLGESYAGRAALERSTLHIHDLAQAEDAARARLFEREGFISACFAPMIAKGELRGVLEVFHRKPFEASQEWLEFLDAMAA